MAKIIGHVNKKKNANNRNKNKEVISSFVSSPPNIAW